MIPCLEVFSCFRMKKCGVSIQPFQFFIKGLKYLHSGVCSSSKRDLCLFFRSQKLFAYWAFGSICENGSALSFDLRYIVINSDFVVRPLHGVAFHHELWVLCICLRSNCIEKPLEFVVKGRMRTYIMIEVILIKPVPICLLKRN